MTNKEIKIEFKYQDLAGNITSTVITRSCEEEFFNKEFETIVDTFKNFLLTCTFTEELITTRIK